ncbi:MAG: DUF3048 domain-containing protein [Candidatus Daviesbacteria bacterium]|nr:DUF3048 domain-containing protein [Candidatus Daviesbacteria bacterium]
MIKNILGNITQTYLNLTNLQRNLVMSIVAVLVYVASTSISYSLFSNLITSSLPTVGEVEKQTALPGPSTSFEEDPNAPKTAECPLNGSMHTEKAKEFWNERRPLAIMIENHTEARPQSGLTNADIIYEAVAEGGITRFMAIYLCNVADVQVGPVRSARTYYLDWLGEYDALYAHVGGANSPGPADALGQIIRFDVKDLNQFSIGFPVFWRDYQRLGHPVATEHTMYSTTQKLWEVGAKRGWVATDSAKIRWDKNFNPWEFKDDQPSTGGNVKVTFWESQPGYEVEWVYDNVTNNYKRINGGDEHKDLNNDKQLIAKVIIVQFQKESRANDGYPGNVHLLYETTGGGEALIIQDGKVTEGSWSKKSRTARTVFLDKNNKEIKLNKGQIWIQTVPEGARVTY